MADFSTIGGVESKSETLSMDTGSSLGIDIITGGANIKGSWVEMTSSSTFDFEYLQLTTLINDTADYLLDIGVGSAGNEEVIVGDVMISYGGGSVSIVDTFGFPIHIAKGSRITARGQASSSSQNLRLGLTGYSSSLPGYAKVVGYGISTGDSGGTPVDPGGSSNTKGAYSEVTSSTNEDLREIYMHLGNAKNASLSAAGFLFDIAIGSAGNEEIIVSNLAVYTHPAHNSPTPGSYRLPIQIPAGTRIAVRSQSSITNATDRILDVAIYGVV